MSGDEFANEAGYLSDVVGWLLKADGQKRRLEFLHHIQHQVEYMKTILEEDA